MNAYTDIVDVRADQVDAVLALARRIWHSHYPGIITREQIDYMLAQRYTAPLLRAQLADARHCWRLARDDVQQPIGFAHAWHDLAGAQLKLDKLYVAPEQQRRGIGRALLESVVDLARARAVERLCLQVNRQNHQAIASYRKAGFEVETERVVDIGNGFVMDDYLMVRAV